MDDDLTRLVDLEYNRFRNSYIQQINDREDQLAANLTKGGVITGHLYWSIVELHVEKIKTLYQQRIRIEKDLMLKKYGSLDVMRMEELKKMVRGIIAQEFRELARNQRLKGVPPQLNYPKLIRDQEISVAFEADTDIEIEMGHEKIRLEEEKRKLYSQEHGDSLMEIFKLRHKVNLLFREKFGFEIFKLEQEGVIPEIATPCKSEDDFVRKILVLGNLIDWMDVQKLKSNLKSDFKEAKSIELLERFLTQHFVTFDPIIIRNLRDVNKLRNKKFPIHKEGEEVIEIFNKLGAKYPPDDWEFIWKRVVRLYIDSIKGLMNLLS